jgi:hypothetical protein
MHTYLKIKDGEYQIGQWLINRDGYHQFSTLFTVPMLDEAIIAVNMLNGGYMFAKHPVNPLHLDMKETE